MTDDERNESNKQLVKKFYNLLDNLNPDYFIEIGAFKAETSIYVSNRFKECQVFAYEANPFNYDLIKDSLNDYNFKYINLAISNSNEPQTLYLHYNKKYEKNYNIKPNHSLSKRNDPMWDYKPIEVQCDKLDNLYKTKNKKYVLWIDTEGHGYNVLKGAEKLLKYVEIIFIEVESHAYWVNQKLDLNIIEYLKKHGFDIIDRDYEYPNQYNIIFKKINE